MRKLVAAVVLAAAPLTFVLASSAFADNDNGGKFKAKLNGYEEVVGSSAVGDSGSVSTAASGRFRAELDDGEIEFELRYSNIEGGTVSQAHIHFAQRHVGGGVIAFLCGGGGKPACPSPSGTVEGTIAASDILGPAGQGIEAGNLMEAVRAMRAGATYVNVHSTPRYPEGEIRGQISRKHRGGDKD
jgi:CHRD domain